MISAKKICHNYKNMNTVSKEELTTYITEWLVENNKKYFKVGRNNVQYYDKTQKFTLDEKGFNSCTKLLNDTAELLTKQGFKCTIGFEIFHLKYIPPKYETIIKTSWFGLYKTSEIVMIKDGEDVDIYMPTLSVEACCGDINV